MQQLPGVERQWTIIASFSQPGYTIGIVVTHLASKVNRGDYIVWLSPNHLNIHSARSPLFQGFQGTNSSIQCQIFIIPWNSFYFQLKSDKFHRFAEPRLLIGQSSGRRPHIETRNSLEPPELSPNEGTIIFRKLVTPSSTVFDLTQ